MKICNVQFENLNSLSGRWQVDFTSPAFESAGIFAITGPTGSGKTTLLDAICLALYGETPRLGRISQNSNHILSRQQGSCESRVTFRCAEGEFLCIFEHHRARKKPNGKLAPPLHHLCDAKSGRIIESKYSLTHRKVAELTGLDFIQFCRSALLAQGDFAAFLHAKEEDRSAILEQITGTELYSNISVAVHERKRHEDDRLQQLSASQQNIFILSDEDQSSLRQVISQLEAALSALQEQRIELQQQLARRNEQTRIQQELQTLLLRQSDLESERSRFSPMRERLQQAIQAQALDARFATLSEKRRQLHHIKNTLSQKEHALPAATAALAHTQSALQHSETEFDRCVREREADLLLQKQVQRLDLELTQTQSQQNAAKQSANQYLSERDAAVHRQSVLQRQKEQLARTVEQSRTLLHDPNAPTAAEPEKAATILQRAARDVDRQLDHLREKQALTTKIISLESERTLLKEGSPCPLCGALSHPFAETHAPQLNQIEIEITKLKKIRQQIQESLEVEAVLDKELAVTALLISERTAQLRQVETQMSQWQRALEQLLTERQALYGNRSPEDETQRWNRLLSAAGQTAEDNRKRHKQAEGALTALQNDIHSLQTDLESLTRSVEHTIDQFKTLLAERGFHTEADFLAARLTESERIKIEQTSSRLDEQHTLLASKIAERNEALTQLNNQPPDPRDETALRDMLAAVDARIDSGREGLGVHKERLLQSEKGEEASAALRKQITRQHEKCRLAADLHALIGSADGKKYRNFAQGLTFERLIVNANVQLSRMTDRYLLLSDAESPLSLNVLDNYQAGEIRTTRNLSGGEGFVVSLALALGLSQMAGQKVRIDSLFLDEGFGTLDDDALETALETLGSLRREGKLIGIISHVPSLKERIPVQIKVKKQPGGTSILSGPGTRALSN